MISSTSALTLTRSSFSALPSCCGILPIRAPGRSKNKADFVLILGRETRSRQIAAYKVCTDFLFTFFIFKAAARACRSGCVLLLEPWTEHLEGGGIRIPVVLKTCAREQYCVVFWNCGTEKMSLAKVRSSVHVCAPCSLTISRRRLLKLPPSAFRV